MATPLIGEKLKQIENIMGINQPLGWRYNANLCLNLQGSSILHHALKWMYELSNITLISFPQTWHGIPHASTT